MPDLPFWIFIPVYQLSITFGKWQTFLSTHVTNPKTVQPEWRFGFSCRRIVVKPAPIPHSFPMNWGTRQQIGGTVIFSKCNGLGRVLRKSYICKWYDAALFKKRPFQFGVSSSRLKDGLVVGERGLRGRDLLPVRPGRRRGGRSRRHRTHGQCRDAFTPPRLSRYLPFTLPFFLAFLLVLLSIILSKSLYRAGLSICR